MTWIPALSAVAAFLGLLHWLRIPRLAARVLAQTTGALRDMRDPQLDERERERRVRGHAGRLFVLFAAVTLGAAAAAGLPLAVLAGLDAMALLELDPVLATMSGWPFLLVTAAGIGLLVWLRKRLRT